MMTARYGMLIMLMTLPPHCYFNLTILMCLCVNNYKHKREISFASNGMALMLCRDAKAKGQKEMTTVFTDLLNSCGALATMVHPHLHSP